MNERPSIGAGQQAGEILDHLRGRRDEIIAFLEALTCAESPSDRPETQALARSLIADRLREENYRPILIPGRTSGGCLYARPQARRRGEPAQLLLGL